MNKWLTEETPPPPERGLQAPQPLGARDRHLQTPNVVVQKTLRLKVNVCVYLLSSSRVLNVGCVASVLGEMVRELD